MDGDSRYFPSTEKASIRSRPPLNSAERTAPADTRLPEQFAVAIRVQNIHNGGFLTRHQHAFSAWPLDEVATYTAPRLVSIVGALRTAAPEAPQLRAGLVLARAVRNIGYRVGLPDDFSRGRSKRD